MKNFIFERPTRIIFGKYTENQVGLEVKKHSNKILFHYGLGSIKKFGLYDRVVESLKKEKIDFVELPGCEPNPKLGLVKEGIKICRDEKINFILAVGGGSVVDSAKAIGIGIPYDGDVWDFFIRKAKVREMIPVGVVLTIPAAGSEASPASVITNEDGFHKNWVFEDVMNPKFAILNPELTFTIPPYHTAAGIVDIMGHVMERYFTSVRNVDFTDKLCEATLKTVIKHGRIVIKEPNNYDSRAEVMWAGTIAHNGLLGTGREDDWVSHDIEGQLSALFNVSHGAGLAVTFPAWMKYVYKRNLNRFVQFAVKVWNVEPDFWSMEEVSLEGINRMENFFKEIGMPTTLKELGIPYDSIEEITERYIKDGPRGSIMVPGKEDVLKILEIAK